MAICDDCGLFANDNDLEPREPWNGGYRHKRGTGCWPVNAQADHDAAAREDALRLAAKNDLLKVYDGQEDFRLLGLAALQFSDGTLEHDASLLTLEQADRFLTAAVRLTKALSARVAKLEAKKREKDYQK